MINGTLSVNTSETGVNSNHEKKETKNICKQKLFSAQLLVNGKSSQ